MKGPGGRFEAEIRDSIPKTSLGGLPLSKEKRHDPPTRGTGGRCRRCEVAAEGVGVGGAGSRIWCGGGRVVLVSMAAYLYML